MVNLMVLLLPLVGIALLRLYENELIRRTESELIAQAACIRAVYSDRLVRFLRQEDPSAMVTGDWAAFYQPAVTPKLHPPVVDAGHVFMPIEASLDIHAGPVRLPAPPARAPTQPSDPSAIQAGAEVSAMLQEIQSVTLAGIRIVDCNGTVVATSRGELGQSLLDREEVARALAGENVSLFRKRVFDQAMPPVASISRGNRVRVFVALPVVHDGRVLGAVVLSRTPLDIIKALYINRAYLLKGAVIMIGAMVLISLLTTLLISRPITALTAQAGNISSGKQGSAGPLKKPGTYEVDLLSHAFSNMAVSLRERADYIQNFASHVSHEFKTPLASMGGTVELLRDHFDAMSPGEREKFMRNMAQDIDRLTLLVSRLLELARADTFTPSQETLELCAALGTLVTRYAQSGLAITLCPCSPPLPVRFSAETLESVIGNLIANSRLHGGDAVAIMISAGVSDEDSAMAEIVFSDTGPGISAANIDKIFTPFFTTARDRGGSGLGLPIIRALVRAHKGDIVCLPADGGARFKITLVRQTRDRDL